MSENFQSNYSLQSQNSLAVPSVCRWYLRVTDKSQLPAAVAFARDNSLPLHVLGAGTNVVLGEFVEAVVVEIAIPGKELIDQRADSVTVEAGAGENWHQLVIWALEQKYYGLENLALIPGTCGAAPIQNIGAYGLEIGELIETVEIYDTVDQRFRRLTAAECQFAYRDSIFKRDLWNRVIVVSIQIKLSLVAQPRFDYPALSEYLESRQIEPTPENIFEAVCAVRRSKLPDPEKIPNVGSFFKNPILFADDAEALLTQHPDMPVYPLGDGQMKIPAAWLIEHSGWKGWLRNGVGVHDQQSLVLINPGRKSGDDVMELAQKIFKKVRSEFGIELEMEPRVIG